MAGFTCLNYSILFRGITMAEAVANPQYSHAEQKRFRKSFGRQADKMAIPNLLDIQLKSYADFLKADSNSNLYQNTGLHAAFLSVFPIHSFSGNARLEYVSYKLG